MASTNTRLRYGVLGVLIFTPLIFLFLLNPILQDPNYHLFADTRAL